MVFQYSKRARTFFTKYVPSRSFGGHVTWNSAVPDPNVWCCILLFLCTLGCVHLRSIERASYATKHVRDTDSDYVIKKPSRCWLGALPRYWKVVASCFQFVSFAENTSANLAPTTGVFLTVSLTRLALPQHQYTSFLCPVSDRIALSFFKELLNKGSVTRES